MRILEIIFHGSPIIYTEQYFEKSQENRKEMWKEMRNYFIKMSILACVLNFSTDIPAANPLEFREYFQQITMTFENEDDARKAGLEVKGLPAHYKLAFSARWDDSNPAHLKTHRLMKKHNIKGTFYLNSLWPLKRDPDYLKKLLSGDCSIGLHTMTHPVLPTLDSYAQFREYMKNRICLEVASQTSINSQAIPYGLGWAPPGVAKSIGKAIMATGVISCADLTIYPDKEWKWGYPPRSLAISRRLRPGDKVPDLNKLENQLKEYLDDHKALELQPSLSMSVHSWHTPEGLVELDKAFKRLTGNPDWWYCNQNEYGAYRYEALNTNIIKEHKGKEVKFLISRICPIELGARLPLWFSIKGANPLSVSPGIRHDTMLEVPHDRERIMPDIYGIAGDKGQSTEIPFVELKLIHPSEMEWIAILKNKSKDAMYNINLSFRFPGVWDKMVIRKDIDILEAEETLSANVSQKSYRKTLYYQYGKPYYAVQCDFVHNGKRYRLYADLLEEEKTDLPETINEAALIFECPDNLNLEKLSMPDSIMKLNELKQLTLKKRSNIGTGVLYPNFPRTLKTSKSYIAVIDFKVKAPSEKLEICLTPWSKAWINGKKINYKRDSITFVPLPGRNRIVIKSPENKSQYVFINGEEKQSIDLLLNPQNP
ncbi:MAG: polysaccharide deacetylase family protein [Victivallales bacterium]|nr:polysaccharide deacetylase family protein [Victivallales bacterium]